MAFSFSLATLSKVTLPPKAINGNWSLQLLKITRGLILVSNRGKRGRKWSRRLTEVVLTHSSKDSRRERWRIEESEGENKQKWVQIKIRQEHWWKIHKGMKKTQRHDRDRVRARRRMKKDKDKWEENRGFQSREEEGGIRPGCVKAEHLISLDTERKWSCSGSIMQPRNRWRRGEAERMDVSLWLIQSKVVLLCARRHVHTVYAKAPARTIRSFTRAPTKAKCNERRSSHFKW